jgi:hypothetical protein
VINKQKTGIILWVILLASTTISQSYALSEEFDLPNPGLGPGHPLYGLERFLEERLEIPLARLTKGRLGEAEKRLRLAEERLAEMEAVTNGRDPDKLEGLRLGYQIQMNRTYSLVNGSDLEEMEKMMLERTMHHIEVLTYLREKVPSQARHGIDMALSSSSQSIGVQIRDRVRAAGENATMGLDELESFGLELQRHLEDYKDIQNKVPSDGPPVDIELPVDVSELITQHHRGPP